MNSEKYNLPQTVSVSMALAILFVFVIINQSLAQCDPSSIDPCQLGKNSILQASYHAQIAKTSIGYSITGENFASNGIQDQSSLTNIPGPSYPMPTDIFPVWGAIGGRTQAVFLASDGDIYAVGEENLLIDASHTSGSAWSVTNLSLPLGVTVCDVSKWEGSATGFGDEEEKEGFLVFTTFSGEAYITGNGAYAIQSQTSPSGWTKLMMPNNVSTVDFAVGYQTLLILGGDGNLYASGPDTHLGDGIVLDLDNITMLETQPPISIFGISQIEAGYSSFLVLDGDGSIHVLGENSQGGLGVGDTDDVKYWSKVGAGCSLGVLKNTAYISTLSTHERITSSSAISVQGNIRSWGRNNRQSITSGDDMIYTCPIFPMGDIQNAVAISNGGHISPFVNINAQICNIGHNADGAFGDGNQENEDYGEYRCVDIPELPEICGTQEADLWLNKSVVSTEVGTGSDIVFTITVSNTGPEASTGSFVRDILSPAFLYLSDDSNGDYNVTTGLWIVGPLDVGESKSLNITVKVLEAGIQSNYAQIFVDNEVDPDSTPGDDSTFYDDDDIVELNVVVCPIDSSVLFLCPGDSILIDNNWIHEAGIYFESTPISSVCDSLHKTTVQYILDPPIPEFIPDCEEWNYTLSVDPSSVWNPSWDNGDNGYETVYDGSESTAILTLETDPDCVEEFIIDLPPLADVELVPLLEDTMLLENTYLELNIDLNPNEWSVQWSPEILFDCSTCLSVNILGVESTEIVMNLEHSSGCIFEPSFFLTIEKEPQHLFVPNIFSPSDVNNNVWEVFNSPNILIETCNVYDRWGNLVYQSNDGIPKWNGTLDGNECVQGVYVYLIQYKDRDDVMQVLSGDITLVR